MKIEVRVTAEALAAIEAAREKIAEHLLRAAKDIASEPPETTRARQRRAYSRILRGDLASQRIRIGTLRDILRARWAEIEQESEQS